MTRAMGLALLLAVAACRPAAGEDAGAAAADAAPATPDAVEAPATPEARPAAPVHTLELDAVSYDEAHTLAPVEIGCAFTPAGSDAAIFWVGLPDEPGAALPAVVKFRGALTPLTSDDNAPLFEGGRFTGYRVGVTVTMLGEVVGDGGEGGAGPARLDAHIADQTGSWTGTWGCST